MKSNETLQKKDFFAEATYSFTIKSNFLTIGSFIEVSSNTIGSQIAFTPDDINRNL